MNLKAHVMQTNQKLNFLNRNLRPIGSSNQGLRMKIESVQRKAARFVNSDWSWESSPTQMLKDLKWNSLEFDRQISSLMLLYKIIN